MIRKAYSATLSVSGTALAAGVDSGCIHNPKCQWGRNQQTPRWRSLANAAGYDELSRPTPVA